jgi:hypothetical protein
MAMGPTVRKVMLTAHVTFSVGWAGAVAAFLALAVAGLTSGDAATMRAADLGAGLITWYVIVPFALASLVTGVTASLGTTWGLVRYYWILIKLALTVAATGVLLLHTQPITAMAAAAASTARPTAGDQLRIQLTVAAAAALVVLAVATALSVYKPRGMTPYGWRKQRELAKPD